MNYTKAEVLDKLNGMTVAQLAEMAGVHLTTGYAYVNGEMGPNSKARVKINRVLGIEDDLEVKESLRDRYGLGADEIAEIAGVSKSTVNNWYRTRQELKTPAYQKIEEALEKV